MRVVLCMSLALLAGACAGPAQTTAEQRERLDAEYRTGSNFPKRQERGVHTSLMSSMIAANGPEKAEQWARAVVPNMARAPKGVWLLSPVQ